MGDEAKPLVPERSPADLVFEVSKAAVSAVPVVGGPIAELLPTIFGPPLEKRKTEWMKSVALRLQALELRLDRLADDPAFLTTLVQAAQIAGRNHQSEKLDALRSAVVNSAIGKAPVEDLRAMFLNLVDEFTPTHLRVLRLFENPNSSDPNTRQLLAREREITDQIVLRLSSAGLVEDPRPYAAIGRKNPEPLVNLGWTLSSLGNQFMHFISDGPERTAHK